MPSVSGPRHLMSRLLVLVLLGVTCVTCQDSATQSTPAPTPPAENEKPPDSNWIGSDRDVSKKTDLVKWLLRGCWGSRADSCNYDFRHAEYPGYDGWYNNPAHPELGAVDTPLLRRVPAYYADGVYEPVVKKRPNPLDLSEAFMKGDIGTQSRTGKTALLVFFGQQVVEEVLDAQRPACPPEYFNIEIPAGHEYRTAPKHSQLPLLRTRYDMRTGFSPGNPRQQLNEITPWLDGGLTYGTSKAWADQLRRYEDGSIDPDGLLASAKKKGLFPEYNTHRLPLANPPPPANHSQWVHKHETAKVSRFFKLGNPRGNENPFLLTFGVLWFRWHNALAKEIKRANPSWKSERIFNEARKWVIASHQSIVINEWLPTWLGTSLDRYKGYNPALDPQIDQFFQSAAMRFGHTLVVPGVYLRDYVANDCRLVGQETIVRTCNFYWRPQEPMLWNANGHGGQKINDIVDIDRLLMGMATQLTEREDHTIVEDLRGRVFGPLEFSRRDLMAVNIQRARDHGLPDFNTARKAYGLPPITDERHFSHTNETIRQRLKSIYSLPDDKNGNEWVNRIDVWVGGLLETSDTPGPLFTAIIKDQFTRIRDADRFWFENSQNGLFSPPEIQRLRDLRLRDIIMSVTGLLDVDMQKNPFLAPSQEQNHCPNTNNNLTLINCTGQRSGQCRVLPPITSAIAPPCVPPNTYDYFSNSEASYILTFAGLTTFIGGLVALLFIMHSMKEKKRKQDLQVQLTQNRASFTGYAPYSVQEWIGKKEGMRSVVVLLNSSKRQVEVCSQTGVLLRAVDLSNCSKLELRIANDGIHLLIRVSNDYDLLLRFDSVFLRDSFLQVLEEFVGQVGINRERITTTPNVLFKQAVTRDHRQKRLEMFFRVVFSQAFNIQHSEEEVLKVGADTAREVIYTELTVSEFAEALSMRADSEFAKKMFQLADKDRNGFISFREFVDMLVIFSKGSAEDKVKLMFDMYDINATGYLTRQDFANMLKSLMETVQADAQQEDVESVVSSMMKAAGLANKEAMNLEDFQRLLREHKDKIEYARLNFEGAPPSQQQQTTHHRRSFVNRARDEIQSIYGNPLEIRAQLQAQAELAKQGGRSEEYVIDSETGVLKDEEHAKESSGPSWWLIIVHYVENSRWQIFWCTLYTLVLLAIFAERAYYYSVEREHSGLRRIAGYGVTVTRGAASAMMFTYSSLLVTMCRNTITRLRETFLNTFIPFDNAVDMHKYIAAWALIFTVMHSIGHAFNFYHIATQTSNDLTCLFRNYFHATHEIPKFHYWCWQTITGVTGIMLALLTAVMFIFALPFSRTHLYNWFWFTHSLYPIYYLLMILHGAGRLIQEPFFHYFFLGPCILYILDSLVSLSRKKVEIPVVRTELLPSGVTMLEFKRPNNFDYMSGQWVRIACPALNSNEYHPFTLSSAPNESNLSVHIRAVGPWTKNIRQIFDPSGFVGTAPPKIYLDGPYGESHQDWYRYEVSVLVGGGIGVTPFSSILKDIVFQGNNKNNTISCKKVYFLWVTKTQKHFEWFVDILRELENADKSLVVSVHIFVTQFYEKFDLRTILLYICERHFQRVCGKSLFTGLKAVTHFGRPNCNQIFRGLQETHPKVRKIGVFSCGPNPLTQQVDQACVKVNKATLDGPIFQHHFENF